MGKTFFDIDALPVEYIVKDICGARTKGRPSGKGELKCECPLLPGHWIEVNVAKEGVWKCFKNCSFCPAKGKGKKFDYMALFFDTADYLVLRKIVMDRMGLTEEQEKINYRKTRVVKEKKQVDMVSVEQRDKTYRAFLKMLPLCEEHYNNLVARGLSPADIERVGFRSLPQCGLSAIAKTLQKEGCRISGVPGFYMKDGSPQINCFGKGIIIPYRNPKGKIIALQIRHDIKITDDMSKKEIKEAKQRRYRWFTSSNKDGGCSASNFPFYGIVDKKVIHPEVVYATEGGLKAAVAQSLCGRYFTAIPGVNCFTAWRELLEYYKKIGIKTVVDAFDSDRATNQQVADNIAKLYEIAREYGFEMVPWNWGTDEKGVDDYLLRLKLTKETHANAGVS